VIVLCGATGALGGRILTRLRERGVNCRALVRTAQSDSSELADADLVIGDVRHPDTLVPALSGAQTVITTVNAIGRILEGERGLSIRDVDEIGNDNLIRAAEAAGVERFVFVSAGGLNPPSIALAPFMAAKWGTEQRLRGSSLREVIVRPDMFQEVWLSPTVKFDWPNGKLTIFGKGDAKAAYVAIDDVAEAVVRLALAEEPPRLVEFGGPEALTRNEAADAFEAATGRRMHRRHIPRVALKLGARALRGAKPEMASLMGMSYAADLGDVTWSAEPLRALGIQPRRAGAYIREVARAGEPTPTHPG
jgi:uncharacterized protein YbjT (DUF2867 family)